MDNIVPIGLIFTSIFIVATMYYVLEFLLSENDKGKKTCIFKKKIILAICFSFWPFSFVRPRIRVPYYPFAFIKLFLLHKRATLGLRRVINQY